MSSGEISGEQEYITMLYDRLDALRTRAEGRLTQAFAQVGAVPQAKVERDVAVAEGGGRLAQLNAVEDGLCFGRLDLRDGVRRYIGRLGVLDENIEDEPLLIDWRAPAARPFYLATAVSPEGVWRRRHIRTTGRRVTGLQDEIFDFAAARDGRTDEAEGLVGEAALLAAVDARRTGRMSDIVETIQAEQDRVIRSDHTGVLVVQGGPGTGKTAVALHRAAYLLYAHRQRLAKRVVLIVGPSATFLKYIGEVLPSLGETGVLLATPGELYPGVRAEATEPPGTAEVKGRAVLADVIAAAVRDRQWVPTEALEIPHDHDTLLLEPHICRAVRERTRAARLPHNQARPLFDRLIVAALARQIADRIGADLLGGENLLDEEDLTSIQAELWDSDEVHAALDTLWPVLTPQRLLTDLFASPERLASAAPRLTAAERELLLRDPGGGWTVADVPLLDEAAELLGEDDRARRAAAAAERRERVTLAQEALDVVYGSRTVDFEDDEESEVLSAYDLLDAGTLAQRHERPDHRSAAQRAAADRTWAFGHVIVDEAQELSEMVWRVLMRRCPARSMTVVGDLAQTGDLAGASSWQRVLEPYVADRWRLAELSVNYRTPAEIAAVAADLLAHTAPQLEPPRAVRESGNTPWRHQVPPGELPAALTRLAAREADGVAGGRLAVLVPTARLTELTRTVAAAVPDLAREPAPGAEPELTDSVVVLDVKGAKGLEFDSVLVVEPERIITESPRGANDLYVALTRATQRLGVLHSAELPPALSRLKPAE